MRKRIVTMLLAMSLISGMLAGCGTTAASSGSAESTQASTTSEQQAQTPASTQKTEESAAPEASQQESLAEETPAFELAETVDLPITDEVTTFSMWCSAPPGGLSVVGSPIMEYITGKTNISLELLEQNMMTANEKFNLMVASQDYPDIISAFDESYSGGAVKGYEDDVIMDLTDLMEENAPNYMAYIQQDQQNYRDAYNDDGQMLFMNGYNDNYVQARGNVIRQDLLDKLGLDTPVTYEEYHDVLEAFKNDGIEYPIWMPQALQGGALLSAGFGVSGYTIQQSGTHFFQKDGTVYSSFLTEEYKEFLQLMAQWYSEGLMAKDFYAIVDDMGSASEPEILNGNVGVWYHMADKIGTYNKSSSVEGFHAVGIADAVQQEGEISHFYQNEGSSKTTNKGISISVQAEDPEDILKFFDWFFTKEGSTVANYGIEGTSFEYDAEGNPQYTDLIANNPDYTFQQIALLYCWADIPTIVDRDRSFHATYTQDSLDAIELYGKNTDGAYEMPTRLSFTAAESDEYASTIGDIETRADEQIVRFVIGELNFDSDWDDFVQELKDMGLERCVELKQTALDRYYER